MNLLLFVKLCATVDLKCVVNCVLIFYTSSSDGIYWHQGLY